MLLTKVFNKGGLNTMKSIKVISPVILLLVILMGWVELAYSRPSATALKPRGVGQSSKNRSANHTTIWELPNKNEFDLKRSMGMDYDQPDIMTHAKPKEKVSTDSVTSIMMGFNFVVKDKSMPKKVADTLVANLLNKTYLHTSGGVGSKKPDLMRHLKDVVRKHSHVARSLEVLLKNIQNSKVRSKLKNGDYENLLIFVASLREFNSAAQSAKQLTAGKVLLNLGSHAGEAVTWPDATRENYMSLVKTYTKKRADASGPEKALNDTLFHRGYKDLKEQLNRKREFAKECKV